MEQICEHIWKAGRGSDDKYCRYCGKYPHLRLRYQCSKCLYEACKFCLDDREVELEILPEKIDKRKETLELRIIGLENELAELKVLIQSLQEKLEQL